MLTDHRPPTRPIPGRRRLGAVLVGLLFVAACTGGTADDATDVSRDRDDGPNRAPLPTIAGGVELPVVDPAAVLVAEGLAFGTPLPSEQAAAEVFMEDPEVASVIARRVHGVATTRLVAQVVVLGLDGPEIFDEGVLDGFVQGVVRSFGGSRLDEVTVGSQLTFRSEGEATTAHGFRDGNLLVVVTAPAAADATLVVERQVAARAKGLMGSVEPVTPMLPRPVEAPFIAVPTVTFQPIPPPEEERPPLPPPLPGATAVQGRYGVVAGERRTVAWSLAVAPATYPSAESLEPSMAALASSRAGGTAAETTEVLDRVVLAANAAPEVEGALATRVFRYGALVLVVEGTDAAQVDAVVADWISALAD